MAAATASGRRRRTTAPAQDDHSNNGTTSVDVAESSRKCSQHLPSTAEELRKARLLYLDKTPEEGREIARVKAGVKTQKERSPGKKSSKRAHTSSRKSMEERQVNVTAHSKTKKGAEDAVYVYGPPPAAASSDAPASQYHGALDLGATKAKASSRRRSTAFTIENRHVRAIARHKKESTAKTASTKRSARPASVDVTDNHEPTTDTDLRDGPNITGNPQSTSHSTPPPNHLPSSSLLHRNHTIRTSSIGPSSRPEPSPSSSEHRKSSTSKTSSSNFKQPTKSLAPRSAAKSATSKSASNTPKASGGILSIFRRTPKPIMECLICADEKPNCIKLKKCGHIYCPDCLVGMFRRALEPPVNIYVKCCADNRAIDPVLIQPHVEKDKIFQNKWNKASDEARLSNGAYCSNKACSRWIHPRHIGRPEPKFKKDPNYDPFAKGKAVCPRGKCKAETCSLCNKKWHGEKQCDEDEMDKKFAELARRQGWQACPSCGRVAQKIDGCNHITCGCGYDFCYRCGREYTTGWHECPRELMNRELEIEAEDGNPEAIEALRAVRAGEMQQPYRSPGEIQQALHEGTFDISRVQDEDVLRGGREEMARAAAEGRLSQTPDFGGQRTNMWPGNGRRRNEVGQISTPMVPPGRRHSVVGQFPPPMPHQGPRPNPYNFLQQGVPGYPGHPSYPGNGGRRRTQGW